MFKFLFYLQIIKFLKIYTPDFITSLQSLFLTVYSIHVFCTVLRIHYDLSRIWIPLLLKVDRDQSHNVKNQLILKKSP